MSEFALGSASLALTLILALSCVGQAAEMSSATAGCPTAVNASNAHDQIIKLSQLLDPSGKLSKMIADFHPHHEGAGQSHHAQDPMLVAASEPEPVKREAVPANATSEQSVPTTTLASLIASPTTSTTTTPATPAANSTSVLPTSEANATTQMPLTAKSGESKNVTVNVFLQLDPDAKTDELVSERPFE